MEDSKPNDSQDNPLEELERQLQRGFLHGHTRLSTNYSNLFQVASTVYALIDLLIERGLLTMDEIEGHVRNTQQQLSESSFGEGLGFTMQREAGDKYRDHPAVEIDCENRLPLCHAVCCTLDVPLSRQDVEEGELRWDLGRPYYLRHGRDSYCCHLNRESKGCGVYKSRPLTCRGYSCAKDERIWKDFENRVPNTESIEALLSRVDKPSLIGREKMAMVPTTTATLGPTKAAPQGNSDNDDAGSSSDG